MSRVRVYSGPYQRALHGLRGLGDPAICLDQNQNTIDCQDPNCTYGDCGAVSTSVPSGACLDQSENQVLCVDLNCTYGDCLPSTPAPAKKPGTVIGPALTAAVAATATPRPAPVVSVPLSSSSMGMFLTGSTLISGVPNLVVLLGGALGLSVVASAVGGRRRR